MEALRGGMRKPVFDAIGSDCLWRWGNVAQEGGSRVVSGRGRRGCEDSPPFVISATGAIDERCSGEDGYDNLSMSVGPHWSGEDGRTQRLNRVLKSHHEISMPFYQ